MGHGPEMFRTFNQQHNPLQKFGEIAKTYGALRQGLRWAPMGPMGPMGQPLKKTTTLSVTLGNSLTFAEANLKRSSHFQLWRLEVIRRSGAFSIIPTLFHAIICSQSDYCNSLLVGLSKVRLSPVH